MVRRKAQFNHPVAMMHEGCFNVPIGIAIQDANYIGKTRKSKVTLLYGFAKNFLMVDYLFWVNQEPY